MSIWLQGLYDDIVEELGQGAGSNRLKSAFPRAANRALSQLENKANTGVRFNTVKNIDDYVTQLASNYEYVLYSGITFWLNRMGFKNSDARIASAALKDTDTLWESARGDYIAGKLTDLIDTEGEDIANLGYVGPVVE